VVLEGNERNGKTGVAAEPELHWDVRLSGGSGGAGNVGASLVSVSHALVTGRALKTSGRVDHWLSTAGKELTLVTGGVDLSEIAPNGEPETVLAIDELTSDLELKVLEQSVAQIVRNLLGASGTDKQRGVVLNPEILEKIAVTGNCNGHAGTSSNGAVDGLENRLNGEVGVAAVNGFEKGNLGLTSQVNVLGAVGNELHKSSSHF